jgi:hypothetical protein
MRTRPIACLALIAVLVAGVAAACGNDSSSSTTTEKKTTTTAAKSFQVSVPDGQVSLSLDGKLPQGWPSSFPLPETSLKPADEKSAGSTDFVGSMKIASPYPGSVTVTEISGSTYIIVLLDTGGKPTTTTAAGAGSSTASTASTTTTAMGG